MPAGNVDVVHRWLTTINAGTGGVLEAVEAFWDVDASYYPVRKFAEAQPSHGRQDVVQWWAQYLEAWFHIESVVNELFEAGDDRVLAWLNLRAEGRGSGVSLEGGRPS